MFQRSSKAHKVDPVFLRNHPIDELHLPKDRALSALSGPQQKELDFLLLCLVVLNRNANPQAETRQNRLILK